jgi:glucosamine--fructose-6-phosphate aminotransferase (isomerizing)
MRPEETLMFVEAAQAPDVVRSQRRRNAAAMRALGERLRQLKPSTIVTLARGSSDNAATYARHLIETRAGVLTSSASPSVVSVYDSSPDMAGTAMLVFSQSGRSPDLLAAAEGARSSGALLIALVNDETSPLAMLADVTLPLDAGPERSVAATKSFIATLAAVLHLVAECTGDAMLTEALDALPDRLAEAWALDWSAALPALDQAANLYVVGRGPGFATAQEAALKFKETCGFHAEAFSAAEVRHGPMALVGRDFPVFLLAQGDESTASIGGLAPLFSARGATVIAAGVRGDITLQTLAADPAIQPLLLIQSFYRLANTVSIRRGHDPDRPPHLAKVTETV